jgi:hypothetical protein
MDDPQPQPRRFEREPGRGDGPDSAAAAIDHQCVELCPICRTADVVRTTLPPEFNEQWQSFQRDAVLMLRAALDHYIERLDAERSEEPPIEDIPIG